MKFISYIIAGLLSSISYTQAFTTDDALHPVAHGAGSYAITHAATVICKKVTGLDTLPCSLISGSIALSVGVAVELSQDQAQGNYKKGLVYDAAGIGLAIGFINLDF